MPLFSNTSSSSFPFACVLQILSPTLSLPPSCLTFISFFHQYQECHSWRIINWSTFASTYLLFLKGLYSETWLLPGLNKYFVDVFSEFSLYSVDIEIHQPSNFQVSVFIQIRYIIDFILMSTSPGFFCGQVMLYGCICFPSPLFAWLWVGNKW